MAAGVSEKGLAQQAVTTIRKPRLGAIRPEGARKRNGSPDKPALPVHDARSDCNGGHLPHSSFRSIYSSSDHPHTTVRTCVTFLDWEPWRAISLSL